MTLKTKKIIWAAVFFAAGALAASTVRDISAVQNTGPITAKIGAVEEHLHEYGLYDYDGSAAADEMASQLLKNIDDEYSQYYTKEQFEEFMMSGQASYLGVGITITAADDEIIIVGVREDSSAAEAGILAGDRLVAVNGIEYEARNMSNATEAIRNTAEGETVKITIERDGVKTELDVEVRSISKDTVESRILDESTGYIRIKGFERADAESGNGDDTSTEFESQLNELLNQNVTKVVLDLRDNGGGDMAVALDIADKLLPSGVISYTVDKKGQRETFSSDEQAVNAEFVVLVNGNTASASELLAGAMRELGGYKIVGTKTYGKGLVQTIYSFTDGSGMKITTAKYYTPNGNDIDKVGIEPDTVSELPENLKNIPIDNIEEKDDTQLAAAKAMFDTE